MAVRVWTTTASTAATYVGSVTSTSVVGGSPNLIKTKQPRSPAQKRASRHNYNHYKIGKMQNILSEMYGMPTVSDESKQLLSDVQKKLAELRLSLLTRKDHHKDVIPRMFFDD